MRKTIPVIGAAIALTAVLVWYRSPEREPVVGDAAEPAPAEPDATPRIAELIPATEAPAPSASGSEDAATPRAVRSPLPGETPSTPMAQVLANNQQNMIVRRGAPGGDVSVRLLEGERVFAAEPVDAQWAPGAEADLLAKFAQMSGLKLIDLQVHCRSTMCRVQLTQPPATPGQNGPTPFSLLSDELGLTPRWIAAVIGGADTLVRRLPMTSIAYYWREGLVPRVCFKDGQQVPCSGDRNESAE